MESRRKPVFAAPTLSLRSCMFGADKLSLAQLASMGQPLHSLDPQPHLWPIVVEVAFENIGDKAADQTRARLILPIKVGLWRSDKDAANTQRTWTADLSALAELARRGQPRTFV